MFAFFLEVLVALFSLFHYGNFASQLVLALLQYIKHNVANCMSTIKLFLVLNLSFV